VTDDDWLKHSFYTAVLAQHPVTSITAAINKRQDNVHQHLKSKTITWNASIAHQKQKCQCAYNANLSL